MKTITTRSSSLAGGRLSQVFKQNINHNCIINTNNINNNSNNNLNSSWGTPLWIGIGIIIIFITNNSNENNNNNIINICRGAGRLSQVFENVNTPT